MVSLPSPQLATFHPENERSVVPVLRAVGIVRRYGSALALRGVDCTLWPGERVVLLGPNGSGKTTLIRVLATAIRPHGGSLAIHGIDALSHPARVRGTIGVLGHQSYLYGDLTPTENLRFYGRLYAVHRLESRIRTVLDEVGLAARASDLVRTLSRGMQQRVALARAILHDPSILLLDEPETGLDEEAQRGLAALVSSWAREGRSVLFASHRLDWAQQLADRAVVLRDGAVVSEEVALAQASRPAGPLAAAPSRYARQMYAIVAKDLLLEFRTKDALTAMVVFALLVLVIFSFALDLRQEVLAAAGAGVLWVTVVFASTLGLGRTFALERDEGTLEGLILAPLDRSALYLAKFAINLLLMAVVETVSVPVFSALLNVPIDPGAVLLALLLGTIGLSAVGTLFSAIAAHTRAREVMLPVLLFPIIVPLLIGVVQATGLALGAPGARDMPWLSLLLAFDAVYVAAGALVFEYTLEE